MHSKESYSKIRETNTRHQKGTPLSPKNTVTKPSRTAHERNHSTRNHCSGKKQVTKDTKGNGLNGPLPVSWKEKTNTSSVSKVLKAASESQQKLSTKVQVAKQVQEPTNSLEKMPLTKVCSAPRKAHMLIEKDNLIENQRKKVSTDEVEEGEITDDDSLVECDNHKQTRQECGVKKSIAEITDTVSQNCHNSTSDKENNDNSPGNDM